MSRPLHTAKEVGQSGSGCCQSFGGAARRTGLLGWFPLLAILLMVGLIHGRSPAEEALLPWSVERVHVVVTPGADSVRCVARFDVRAVGEQRAAIPLLAGSFTVESVSATRGARAAAQADRLLCILGKPGEAAVTVTFQVPIERTDGALRFTVPLAETLQTQLQLHLPDRNYWVAAEPPAVISQAEAGAPVYRILPLSSGPLTLKAWPFGVVAQELTYSESHTISGVAGRSGITDRVDLYLTGPQPAGPLEVEVPEGAKVRGVTSLKPFSWRLSSDGRRLFVTPAPGAEVRQSVSIDLDFASDPDDPVLSLRSVNIPGVRRRAGQLQVMTGENGGVEILETQGLTRTTEFAGLRYRFGEDGFQTRFRTVLAKVTMHADLRLAAVLSRGAFTCQEQVTYSYSGGRVREFRLRTPAGMKFLPVGLPARDVCWLEDGVLVIRPSKRPDGEYQLNLEYELPLADLSRIAVPILEPIADKLTGQVSVVVAPGLVAEVLESEGLTFWYVLSGQPHAGMVYRVAGPNPKLLLQARRRTPVLEAKVLSRVSFEGERTLLRSTLVGEITRAPLSQLHVQLPAQFVVTEVEGSPLKSWELVGEGTVLRLDLGERYLGEVRLQVSAERLRSSDEVQVEVGPVALREATRARGYLAVVPNRDLMVTAEEVTGLLATAPDRVPKELGTVPEQALCYSVTDEAWARLLIAPVQPLARARSATILHFTQGLLSVGCHVTLTVTRGGVEVVDAVIPAGSADVVVSGSAVKGYERVGEDTWRIRFAGKVYDRTAFDIDFKSIISQAQQLVTYPGVVLVDVAQTGVVTVATDPDFEVEEREVTGLAGTMEKGGPGYGELVDGRALYGYSFERVPFTLSLLTTRLARAETVQARATAAQLTTVVAGRRTAVSRMLYFVENPGRKQYVTVYLGDRALWSTTANGIPVKPARAEDGRVLVPIAEESQQTGTVQVELIFTEPIPPLGGAAATLALRAPKLDIPVEDLRWDVYTPEGYFLFTSTGELLPYDTPEVAGLGALAQSFFHVLGGAVSTVLSWLPGALGDVLEGALEFVRDYWWLFVLGAIVGIYLILRYVFHVVIRVSLIAIVVLIGMVSLLVAMLMPALSTARQAAWASNSRSNLKQIGLALFMYSSANNDVLPVSADQLVPYLEGRAAFENPSALGTGYNYVQGLPPVSEIEDPANTIVMFEEEPGRDTGTNVLFLDGHVERLPMSAAEVMTKAAEQSAGAPLGFEVARSQVALSAPSRPGFLAGEPERGETVREVLAEMYVAKEFEAEDKQQRAQQVVAGRQARAREEAREVTSRSNLKQIGLGLAIYANDHDGLYPQSLDDLYPNYVTDRRLLVSPSTGRRYRYISSRRVNEGPQSVIAFEDVDGDARGTNLLFADGHVEFNTFTVRPEAPSAAVKVTDEGAVTLFDALSRSDYEQLQTHSYGVPPAAEPLDVDLDALAGRIDIAGTFVATTVLRSVRGRAEGAMPMLLALPTGGERYRLYQPFAEREPGGFTLALVPRGPFQWVQVLLFFALAGGLAVLARRRPGTVLGVTGAAAAALLLVVLSTSGGLWLLSEAALTGTVVALVFAAVIYQRRRTLQQKSV